MKKLVPISFFFDKKIFQENRDLFIILVSIIIRFKKRKYVFNIKYASTHTNETILIEIPQIIKNDNYKRYCTKTNRFVYKMLWMTGRG
jgi:hypothetical protein